MRSSGPPGGESSCARYGIVVARAPDRCPMCRSEQLDFAAGRPFRGRGIDPLRSKDLVA
jgi:hypothetical protein